MDYKNKIIGYSSLFLVVGLLLGGFGYWRVALFNGQAATTSPTTTGTYTETGIPVLNMAQTMGLMTFDQENTYMASVDQYINSLVIDPTSLANLNKVSAATQSLQNNTAFMAAVNSGDTTTASTIAYQTMAPAYQAVSPYITQITSLYTSSGGIIASADSALGVKRAYALTNTDLTCQTTTTTTLGTPSDCWTKVPKLPFYKGPSPLPFPGWNGYSPANPPTWIGSGGNLPGGGLGGYFAPPKSGGFGGGITIGGVGGGHNPGFGLGWGNGTIGIIITSGGHGVWQGGIGIRF